MFDEEHKQRNDAIARRVREEALGDERDQLQADYWAAYRGEDVGRGFYDREGQPMGQDAWRDRLGTNYARVARTEVPVDLVVSTSWVGMDHGKGGDAPPLMYETAVLDAFGGDVHHEYYGSEADALAGHERWVRRMTA